MQKEVNKYMLRTFLQEVWPNDMNTVNNYIALCEKEVNDLWSFMLCYSTLIDKKAHTTLLTTKIHSKMRTHLINKVRRKEKRENIVASLNQ